MTEVEGWCLEGELERFREAGLYDPSSPAADQRQELLEHLLEQFSVDEILEWLQHTNLVGVAARSIDRPPAFISAEEAATRAGVALDVVTDMRAAFGLPVLDPASRSIPETVVDDVKTFLLGEDLYGRENALAFARVLGWSATRITEAARSLFAGSIECRDHCARTELETAKANEVAIAAWTQVQFVVDHLLAEQPLHNTGFAEALLRGELDMAVAFVDLVASTEWAESVDPGDHSDALRRFEMRSFALAADHGARLVKLIGDAAMVVTDDPVALCRVALAICEMARADPMLPDARGAVGYGLVTARDGDYFGPLVNVVARASKVAAPGGIVVTTEVARFLDPVAWSTEPMGPQDLRGARGKVDLLRVTPAASSTR